MIKLIKYLKPYTWSLILMLGLTLVQVMTTLQLPDYMAKIVNEGIVQQNQDLIWSTGLLMLLVTLLGAVCTIAVSYLAAKVGPGFSRDVREKVFTRIEHFSL